MSKNWLHILQHTDENYLEEAAPGEKRKKRKWIGVLAACLCCVLAASLFIPFRDQLPDTTDFDKSEYYDLIQALNKLDYRAPLYGNTFELLQYALGSSLEKADEAIDMVVADGAMPEAMAPTDAVADAEPGEAPQYQEVTDNQVSGVTEADRIKRTDKHIYYLDGGTLRIYSIAGEESSQVGEFSVSQVLTATVSMVDQWEFYLSRDGSRVNVIAPCLDRDNQRQVQVLCLDTADPANISCINTFTVSGQNISSRVTEGSLLLMTRYRPGGQMDFSDEKTFLPQISMDGEMKSIPADKIFIPEEPTDKSYLVIMKLDAQSLALNDCMALLSCNENLYVSQERIYACSQYLAQTQKDCTSIMTQLVWLDYGAESFGTADSLGSIQLEGYLKDQYSMDEYAGILRVVTTTERRKQTTSQINYGEPESIITVSNDTSANLYCIDLQTQSIAGKVEQFAPNGETVRSVRFDGTDAYVCTAVQLTDPVFFFDLSDVNNITYKDTGNIEGFSSSLVNFGNGYLLGIGRGDSWETLKVEIYEEGTENVVSVCSFQLPQVWWSENYKSYYIDRQQQLLGMGYEDHSGESRYLVLLFDGYALDVALDTQLPGVPDMMRGVYIDGWFYLLGEKTLKTQKLF